MYSCDGKAEISAAITPVSSDLSQIIVICWFGAQKTFLNIIDVVLFNILWKHFSGFFNSLNHFYYNILHIN